MENKGVIYQKSYAFAIRIVKAYKYLCQEKNEYVLSKQLLRSGTSIGANCSEGGMHKVHWILLINYQSH